MKVCFSKWALLPLLTLFSLVTAQRGTEPPFYLNSDSLLDITPANINDLVYNTSYVTLLEFYAPWCGYCKQLKPSIEKLSDAIKKKNLPVQVAIVNCDDASNSMLCSEYDVQGFPTLLTVTPKKLSKIAGSKKASKKNYNVEVYKGEREYKPMLNHLVAKSKKNIKIIKDFENFYNAVTDYNSSLAEKPFVVQLFDAKNEKSKKTAAIEEVLETTQTQFANSVRFFKIQMESVTSKVFGLCKGNNSNMLVGSFCSEIMERMVQAVPMNNLLMLFDPKKDQFSIFKSQKYDSGEKENNRFKNLNYKLTSWILNNVDGENVRLLDGPFSAKKDLLEKHTFKNKYRSKNKNKNKKKPQKKADQPLDEL